jgi:hypothetical protein
LIGALVLECRGRKGGEGLKGEDRIDLVCQNGVKTNNLIFNMPSALKCQRNIGVGKYMTNIDIGVRVSKVKVTLTLNVKTVLDQ